MSRFIQTFKKERGIGLLELMLALAIIAILLVMATRYFLVTSRSEQVNRMTSQIKSVDAAASKWKSGKSDYTGMTMQDLINMGLIATGDLNAGQTLLLTPWGTTGNVSVVEGNLQYTITYANLPSWACSSLEQVFTNTDVTVACNGTTFTYTGPPQ